MATRQTKFLNELRSALGTPYVWGGSAPGGFDCSGLVYWAAKLAGIRGVPRTSEEQYKVGRPVSLNRLLPGDLVFAYPEAGGPGHVVVYIGGGKVIAAPHTGTNVQVESLSAFKGVIVGARRVLANPQGGVYKAGQFVGGGNTLQHDAKWAPQQQQAQQKPRISLPLQLPQFNTPTAQQTLQNTLSPLNQKQAQPGLLNPNQPNAQAGMNLMPAVSHQLPTQLQSLHDQLLRATT